MIPLATILNIITLVLLAWVVVKRGYVYLHFFQQEEYHLARFFTWWVTRGAFDRKATLGAGLAWLCTGLGWGAWAVLPLWFGLVWAAITTHDPQQEGKKKLVMTPRATRIFYVGMALLLMIVAAWGDEKILLCLLLVHIIPLALMAANDVLWPFEEWVRQKYVAEAKNILASVRPAIIGITGSFGKTSVKHVLGHVLSAHAPVAWAAGSINTAMGLTRFVREHVRPGHKFLIAEMGAYQRGSVARLCKIFPPRTGIITTLGKEHFERFKSLDNIALTHLEMVEAADGTIIGHEQLWDFSPIRQALHERRQKFFLVGTSFDNDLVYAIDPPAPEGQGLTLTYGGETQQVLMPLHGKHQALNAALAVAQAVVLGMNFAAAVRQLASMPAIKHRLEVKKLPRGVTLIDDAYNSNPDGFCAALDVLDSLGKAQGGRRIIITPGMVELGTAHDTEHEKIGRYAATRVDHLLLVVPQRIQALARGFVAGGGAEQQMMRFETFAEARQWLDDNQRPNDVVLLENDLPDLYEEKISL